MSGPGVWENNALIHFIAEVLTLEEQVKGHVEDFVHNLRIASEALTDHREDCVGRREMQNVVYHLAGLYRKEHPFQLKEEDRHETESEDGTGYPSWNKQARQRKKQQAEKKEEEEETTE